VRQLGVLAGPNIAGEIAQGKLAGTVIARAFRACLCWHIRHSLALSCACSIAQMSAASSCVARSRTCGDRRRHGRPAANRRDGKGF